MPIEETVGAMGQLVAARQIRQIGLSAHPLMGHEPGRLPAQKVKMAMAVDGKNRR